MTLDQVKIPDGYPRVDIKCVYETEYVDNNGTVFIDYHYSLDVEGTIRNLTEAIHLDLELLFLKHKRELQVKEQFRLFTELGIMIHRRDELHREITIFNKPV